MPLSIPDAISLVTELIDESKPEHERHQRVRNYLDGDHDAIYMYRGTSREYKKLIESSVLNLCPTIVGTTAQRLYVDGYRSNDASANEEVWGVWQANNLDAKQAIVHASVVAYGVAYAVVLPGDPVPVITPKNALRMSAMFDDDEDALPVYAIERMRSNRYKVYDDTAIYTFQISKTKTGEKTDLINVYEHNLGYCPVVVFRNAFDATNRVIGDIERVIPLQNSLNQTNTSISLAQELGAHRQKYMIGYEVPEDENGQELRGEDLEASLARIWQIGNPNVKVGEFDQTDISGSLKNRAETIKNIAIVTSIPAHHLLGDLVNISGDALSAVETSQNRRVGEKQAILGESWELALSLAASMSGIETEDSAQITWRDTSTRSIAQVVDALGKMAALLGIPPRGLWHMVPGVTQADINDWEALAAESDIALLVNQLKADTVPEDTLGIAS